MSNVIQFPKNPKTGTDSEDPNALECEWCSKWVAPMGRNVDGRGFTYLRDESGDIICPDCLILPCHHVRAGNA